MVGRKEELGKNTLWLCPVIGFVCALFCFDTYTALVSPLIAKVCDIVVLMAHFF